MLKNTGELNDSFIFNSYKLLLENHSDAVYTLNLQGGIIYANQASAMLFGYSKDELLNLSYKNIISPGEFEAFHYYFQKAVRSETHEFELEAECKNSNKIELQVKLVPIEFNGQIISISVYAKDITEQKKVELDIIRTSKELCESFIENNRDPILLLDLDATIVLANRSFSQLLGWRKENLEGIYILHCPSIPPHLVEQMKNYYQSVLTAECRSNSNVSNLETIRITNEGKAYHMMLSITSIHGRDGEVCNWAVHLRDVTAQKEAENKLLRAEKLLSVGQIAAGITHEIRNPLTSLKGFTELMRADNRFNHHYLDIVADELNQIETFIDEISLLARTRVKSYKMTDITHVLQRAITALKPQATMNNVKIEFEHDQIPGVWCEEEQLNQAFFHIIQNAIEAMPDGGTLYTNIKSHGESLSITVIDQGVGISEERIHKLGEPFYSNNEKGIGLGLMLTYKIIEQHSGNITIQSKVGYGTQITISLPMSNHKK